MSQTQCNVLLRKFGKLAILIAVTDWEDFKELESQSEHDNPDFLLGGVVSQGNIYNNMNMQLTLGVKGEIKDLTEQTRGAGLDGIITGGSHAGPIWAYRKIDGLFAVEEMIRPKMSGNEDH